MNHGMNYGRLFSAGVIAGVVFSVIAAFARAAGVHADLELWWGALLLPPGKAAWLVGFFMHLTIAGFAAVAYGRVLVLLAKTPGAPTTILETSVKNSARIAMVHALFTGIVLGVLPFFHPRIPELIAAPGPFLTTYGVAGVSVLFALHLAYGIVVGALAEPQPVVVKTRPRPQFQGRIARPTTTAATASRASAA